jgi:hypothetical protein
MEEQASDLDFIFGENHLDDVFLNHFIDVSKSISPSILTDVSIIENIILPKAKTSIATEDIKLNDATRNQLEITVPLSQITQRQQKLILLFHSSQCNNGPFCSTTGHCWGMKQLFIHIKECNARVCPLLYCSSSKLALHHYTRCKDLGCLVCGSVRKIIYQSLGEHSTWPFGA